MRSTCINHPANENLLVIREWMMAACKGNGCAAALLNYFIYWHDSKKGSVSKSKHYNNVREQHGDDRSQDESLYQWHTTKELEAGIVGLYSARSIPKGIKVLEDLGFVSVHSNPNKRYKYDQTKYFMVYPDVINAWIDEYNKSKTLAEDTIGKIADRSGNFAPPLEETDPSFPEYNPQNCEIQSAILPNVTGKIAEPITKTTSLSSSETTKKNKEADFVFSEIRDLKNEALDEENINSTTNVKSIEDPSPLPPLPVAPENPVKARAIADQAQQLKRFENRFQSGYNKYAPKGLEEAGFGEWHLGKSDQGTTASYKNWRESLIKASCANLKTFPQLDSSRDAGIKALSNLCKNSDWCGFSILVDAAIAIEEADRRLEAMQITKPECTTTYWYLWGADANAESIYWAVKPQSEDAPEGERKNRQIASLNKLLKRLSDRGLLHLAIEGKHKLHSQHVTAANLTLFPKMIADLGLYLKIQAQQLQGAIAA